MEKKQIRNYLKVFFWSDWSSAFLFFYFCLYFRRLWNKFYCLLDTYRLKHIEMVSLSLSVFLNVLEIENEHELQNNYAWILTSPVLLQLQLNYNQWLRKLRQVFFMILIKISVSHPFPHILRIRNVLWYRPLDGNTFPRKTYHFFSNSRK